MRGTILGAVSDFNSGGVNVSAANGTPTKVALRNVGQSSPACVLVNDEAIIQESGLYAVTFTISFPTLNQLGTRRAELWKNGALWDLSEMPGNGGGFQSLRPGSMYLRLKPSDRLAAYGMQTSGSAMNISGGLSVQRIGPSPGR